MTSIQNYSTDFHNYMILTSNCEINGHNYEINLHNILIILILIFKSFNVVLIRFHKQDFKLVKKNIVE